MLQGLLRGITIAGTEPFGLIGFAPAVGFGTSHNINDAMTVNFGATAYASAAPSGFGNWPGSPTTLDSSTLLNATLSGGNLIATSNSFLGGGARNINYKTTGLYYFEVTFNAVVAACQSACGIIDSAATYDDMNSGGINSTSVNVRIGDIFSNQINTFKNIGAVVAGDIVGVAINLTTRKGWFRRNGGNWNGDATANPATGVGGVTIAP